MSDDFIPLNQSTPVGNRWQGQSRTPGNQNQQNWQQNQSMRIRPKRGRGNNRWKNNSQRNSSYGSDSNNSSYGQEKPGIDAYLHPSMTQDPWVPLRKWLEENKK